MSRREALVGAFALPGAMILPNNAARAGGLAVLRADAISALDELIADCRLKEMERLTLFEAYEALESACADKLPARGLFIDTKARVFDADGAAAVSYRGVWHLKTEDQVRTHFRSAWWQRRGKKAAEKAAIAELKRNDEAHAQARHDLGLTDAKRLSDAAGEAHKQALDAIFSYRPASLDEMDRKNAWIADRWERGLEPTDDQWQMIFSEGRLKTPPLGIIA